MENQSPTLQRLSETRKKTIATVKENLNYIYIGLMVIANCLISLLKIENGKIGLSYPNTLLGWVLWVVKILSFTTIGVMILRAFRRQGIKNGHEVISGVYKEYLEAVQSQIQTSNPRSLKLYMKKTTIKDALGRGGYLIIANLLVLSLTISVDWNSFLSLITNIILSISFGLRAMLEAEEFVVTELILWYKIKIKEIKDGEQERTSKPQPRSTKSGRVQQAKEHNSRSSNINTI